MFKGFLDDAIYRCVGASNWCKVCFKTLHNNNIGNSLKYSDSLVAFCEYRKPGLSLAGFFIGNMFHFFDTISDQVFDFLLP